MCGICGIYSLSGEPPDPEAVERMKRALVHRGPDQEGTYTDAHVALGHRRLSIIGVADGRQPLSNEDGTVWVTFNGEIYNHRALRDWLSGRGHALRTGTDTEVLVHLYEEEGPALVTRLRGMFAFALWDRKRRRLLLARDRLGKKPLYYSVVGGRLLFGSEIKAVLAAGDVPRHPDLAALHDYLGLGYVPAPRSGFEGIAQLPAGCYLEVGPDGPGAVTRYWDIRFSGDLQDSEDQLLERIDAKLVETVRIRLESEVPLGVFLSGGVDSSAIAQRVQEAADAPVISTTIRFDDPAYDESPFARRVADWIGTQHHERRVDAEGAEALLGKVLWHFDQPFADSSAFPTYFLCKTARDRLTVALSGDGGDELFAGYNWYRQLLDAAGVQARVGSAFRRLARPLAAVYPRYARGRAFLRGLNQDPPATFADMRGAFAATELAGLYGEAMRGQVNGDGAEGLFREMFRRCGECDLVSAAQYADYHSYLADDILVKVDRMSMAHGLEVRSPLLDHELVELLARVPSRTKLRDGGGKWIFKKLLERSLPSDVLYREKQGFSVPLDAWFRGGWNARARELLFDGRLAARGYFDMSALRRLWDAQQGNAFWRTDLSYRIWIVVMLEMWHRMYIDSADFARMSEKAEVGVP